jgi:signal transduction histidine kinase
LLYWRKPDDGMALFVSFYMLAYGIVLAGPLQEVERLWRGTEDMAIAAQVILWTAPTTLLLLLFPSGRFVPRWTRWLLPVLILEALASLALWPRLGSPESFDLFLVAVLLVAYVGLYVVGVCAQIYRYRHVSGPIERRQAKWAVFGLVGHIGWFLTHHILLGVVLVMQGIPSGEPFPWWAPVSGAVYAVSLNILPVSLGIALLRHRLWDIDIFINRALVYGALTALVIATYGLVVGSFGALFQSSDNLLVALLATGLAAILFQPLRERLQRGVNRLMYGERDDPYTVLSRLGQRLEATLAPGAGLPAIVETVAQALKLPFVAIALEKGEEFETVSSVGLSVNAPFILPLTYQGETIGQLICAPRTPGEEFSPADRRLLENIARQAGAVSHAVRLADDLQRSRVRLVTAREEERRRLRRDLHDGLGPQLASLILKLDAARNLLPHDPDATATLLGELKTQTQGAIADIRRLVYNLRPPPLDELGLVAALREHATIHGTPDGLRVSVEAPERLPPLPAAVEVAAYRIALEALTNVARHADAETCMIRFTLNGALQLEIIDDGRGVPQGVHAGVGLTSMRERAAELGGACEIGPAPNGGTRILARLPLLPAEE